MSDPTEREDILARIEAWAGGAEKALLWYWTQPISAFGDKTAETLVKTGQATHLRDYLGSIDHGGFA